MRICLSAIISVAALAATAAFSTKNLTDLVNEGPLALVSVTVASAALAEVQANRSDDWLSALRTGIFVASLVTIVCGSILHILQLSGETPDDQRLNTWGSWILFLMAMFIGLGSTLSAVRVERLSDDGTKTDLGTIWRELDTPENRELLRSFIQQISAKPLDETSTDEGSLMESLLEHGLTSDKIVHEETSQSTIDLRATATKTSDST